ncbi:MAG: DNA topoisomerase I [Candidatus Diapherotrites archaeon]|nr:DNA topoisomerase I [Candidatus Diapherotrites archaeon]
MKLIIAEKAIAGKRIASILAGQNIPESGIANAKAFLFERKGEQFTVVPLRGHIVDVDFPKKYSYWIGTDLKNLITSEIEYIGKEKLIINALKKVAKGAEEIIVATDSDREGEAIGVEALNIVKEANPKINISRAYFSAITQKDIEEAFDNLGKVDYNFADSADSRREIDLLWGAVLTRFMSIVSGKLGKEFLSIGRVQTPTLAIIVDREKERRAFKEEDYWLLSALLEKNKSEFIAEHKKGKFFSEEEAKKSKENCINATKALVKNVSKKKRILSKPLPFNTTAFLRAATAIGLTAGDAMNQAESLYQKGFTSYPRTDNTVYPKNLDLRKILSELSQVPELSADAKEIAMKKELIPSTGKESKDHPPIHPVAAVKKSSLPDKEWKVYELISRRFLATLSDDAETENLSVDLLIGKEAFVAHGQVLLNPGWKKYYPYSTLKEVILPPLIEGDEVDVKKMNFEKKKTTPPNRYSQSSLIKLMEEKGLGTKSTRHVIIQKLYARGYISGLKALIPNEIAFAVIDAMEKYDVDAVKAEMSAGLEQEMDLIAVGKKSKEEVVTASRGFLEKILEKLLIHKNEIGSLLRESAYADSFIGKCDKCGGNLRKIKSKNNKWFLGCTNYPKCTNTYPLPQKGKIISLDKLCEHCGKPMIQVINQRFKYTMCIEPNCKSKENWKTKANGKKEEKPAEEKAETKEKTVKKTNVKEKTEDKKVLEEKAKN